MAAYTRDEIREKTIKLIHNFIPELENAVLTEDSIINTDTNIDSLSLIMLVTKVESTFDIRIPGDEWHTMNTLGDLVDRIEKELEKQQ
jgi:acyl carrier protein